MSQYKISEIRIQGLRCLKDIRLNLDGLTVLIGDNATGKSSMIEACELLHKASKPRFLVELNTTHRGLSSLLRQGLHTIKLGLTISGENEQIEYDFSIIKEGQHTLIDSECLRSTHQSKANTVDLRIDRNRSQAQIFDPKNKKMTTPERFSPDQLILSSFGTLNSPEYATKVMDVLENIEVHLPFDVSPLWAYLPNRTDHPLRGISGLAPAEKLERYGRNLTNAVNALRNKPNQEHWEETMDLIKLGLGDDVENIITKPDPAGGSIGLWIKYDCFDYPLPASALSDGSLAYIAFVVLFRLNPEKKSLIAFDEPDLHLHPYLLMRVLDLFESAAETCPVIIATHSDRLLDGLSRPFDSAVLCELDDQRATRLIRPDKKALDRWLERYRGLGDIRSAGHEASVMKRDKNGEL